MSEKKNDLISIIIPVYMVEDCIERCLKSVISQTYENIEIILIDDGTKDNSGKICDEYASKDKRIKVIHKENGGLSDARNVGIDNSSGRYITFIDSDDYVESDYIEYMYELLIKNNCKMSICSTKRVFFDGKIIDDSKKFEKLMKKNEVLERMLYADGIGCSAWGKLYERDLFDGIRFPVGRNYEEIATTYKLIDKCDKISCGLFAKYYYAIRNNSITQGVFSEKRLLLIEATNEMCDYIYEKYPELKKAVLRRRIYANLSIYRQMVECNNRKYRVKEKEIRKYLLKNGNSVIFDKRAPKRDRIALILLKCGRGIFRISWRIYGRIN